MTTKEFKAIFNEVANFDIYGWEGILAMIERCSWANSKDAKDLGQNIVFESEREKANIIHTYLEERGYYNI